MIVNIHSIAYRVAIRVSSDKHLTTFPVLFFRSVILVRNTVRNPRTWTFALLDFQSDPVRDSRVDIVVRPLQGPLDPARCRSKYDKTFQDNFRPSQYGCAPAFRLAIPIEKNSMNAGWGAQRSRSSVFS